MKALGCEGISKSQVSRICGELDRVVDSSLGGAYYMAGSQKVIGARTVNAEGEGRSLVWTWARVRRVRSGLRSCVRWR